VLLRRGNPAPWPITGLRAAVRVPDGEHEVRIAAAGFLPVIVEFAVGKSTPPQTACKLAPAELEEVFAVGGDGRAVPFVTLSLVPHDFQAGIDPSLRLLADSCGRARVPVSRRGAGRRRRGPATEVTRSPDHTFHHADGCARRRRSGGPAQQVLVGTT